MHYIYAAAAVCVAGIVIPVLLVIVLQYVRICNVPDDIPWVGLRGKRWFPKLRATFNQFTAGKRAIEEGWEKVTHHPPSARYRSSIAENIAHLVWQTQQSFCPPRPILAGDRAAPIQCPLDCESARTHHR